MVNILNIYPKNSYIVYIDLIIKFLNLKSDVSDFGNFGFLLH